MGLLEGEEGEGGREGAADVCGGGQLFYLCQRAVTHPIAPLYDSKEQNLKPAATAALQRIFCG